MEELQLGDARNHGMPLEALRYPVTPVGLHYLLIHYDIPVIDARRLAARGRRRASSDRWSSRSATCAAMPATTRVADDGVRRQRPRAARPAPGEPAVAASKRSARASGPASRCDMCWTRPVSRADAVEVLFTGADRGIEGGVEQAYQRSIPVDVATSGDVLLAYDLNGAPLPPQHGFPLAFVVARLVRHDQREVAERHHRDRRTVRRLPADRRLPASPDRGRPRRAAVAHGAAVADGAARHPRLLHPGPHRCAPASASSTGRAWSGMAPIVAVEVSTDGGRTWQPRRARRVRPTAGEWQAGDRVGMPSPASTSCAAAPPTRPATASPSSRSGTAAATPTTPSTASRSPSADRSGAGIPSRRRTLGPQAVLGDGLVGKRKPTRPPGPGVGPDRRRRGLR